MKKGMKLDEINYKLAPVSVSIVKKLAPDHFVLRFELMQGVNRQIRRMCHAFSWSVLRLKRIAHGPIKLGKLEPGRFRYLTKKRSRSLHGAVFKKNLFHAIKFLLV